MELLLGIFALLAVVLVAYLILHTLFGLRFQVVPEEKRVVIYRLGKFHRIAGPGVVTTWGIDTVEREINARNEPHNLRVENVYMKGIPFGYTLNMWLRADPVTVAGNDKEQLRELALFNDREREQQIAVKLREALVKVVAITEKSHQLKKDSPIFEKLLPIFPGLPYCEQLLKDLQTELQITLPSIGIVVNDHQPIAIAALHLSPTILNGFKHGHIASLLREQFPDLPSERILRTLSTIDGIDLQEQRVILDGDSSARASMDFRQGEDGIESRLKTYLTPDKDSGEQRRRDTVQQPFVPNTEKLTKDDLKVLKQVPPTQGQRIAAS